MAAIGGSGASVTQYDVFLSFRGPDTRNTFTDCLYRIMVDKGIVAYRDSEELEEGNRIDDLLRMVGESKIFIPVLSSGYASSAWCLRELAGATELNESTGKPAILPIFFDVTPLDVKLRTQLYVKDLEKHEGRLGGQIRQRSEAALKKLTEMKGWEVEVQGKPHGEVIELVVKKVLRELNIKRRHVDSKLVGVDAQVEAIMKLVDVHSGTGVRFVGIYGMGGIGKSTLAKIVFNELCLCPYFDNQCSYIKDIRESSNRNGLVSLQKKLESDISGSRFVEKFIDTDEGIVNIGRKACSKRVLLVLDDLDKEEQLKKLAGGPETFGSGSRIIITTRNRGILDQVQGILAYEVKEMDHDKALELFSWHAFNSSSPPDIYQTLSRKVVSTTGGLPLALEVIGRYLGRKKEQKIWEEMLEMLKQAPHKDIQDKLKISYDALGHEEKQIFLDIACFFINEEKSIPTYFWDACNLYPHNALEELIDLCLIKIVDGDFIWMHDQLKDLGRAIVRQECPQNPSRLWKAEEALELVRSEEIKDKVEALDLVGTCWDPIAIVDDELKKMPNLKLLKLKQATFVGDISNYLTKLRWLSLINPTLDRGMANLHLKNLVIFELRSCYHAESWNGWTILETAKKLKVLSLTSCQGLKRTPDFSGCLSLERLFIGGCHNLQEVDSSIGKLKHLTHLDIIVCESLQTLPEEIGGLLHLKHFSIKGCSGMIKIPDSIGKLASLSELNMSNTKIRRLPDSIGNLIVLQNLDISRTNIVKLPNSIENLTRLQKLYLMECHELQELPKLPSSLICLRVKSISLRVVPDLSNLTNLVELYLVDAGEIEAARASNAVKILNLQGFGKLFKLEKLSLSIRAWSTELGCLTQLRVLTLFGMDSLDLVIAGPQFTDLKKLTSLWLERCPVREIQLDGLELLTYLIVDNCDFLEGLSIISPSMRKLREMTVLGCPELLEIRFLSAMESLKVVDVSRCGSLQRMCGLSNVKKLKWLSFVECGGLRVVEGLEELKLLHCLQFYCCGSLEIRNVSNLKISNECRIKVWGCSELPAAVGGIETYGEYREELLERTAETLKKEDETEKDLENKTRKGKSPRVTQLVTPLAPLKRVIHIQARQVLHWQDSRKRKSPYVTQPTTQLARGVRVVRNEARQFLHPCEPS